MAASSWFDIRVIGTLALFASTLVVIKHVHDMMTDVALMAGAALGFCGLFELVWVYLRDEAPLLPLDARRRRQAILSGAAMFGAGVGVSLLAKGLSLKLIAGRVGLKSSVRLGQAFERRFGVAPSLFRQMHAPA